MSEANYLIAVVAAHEEAAVPGALGALQANVQALTAEGYAPQGGVTALRHVSGDGVTLMQAMWKEPARVALVN
jgi:hypothetical protein